MIVEVCDSGCVIIGRVIIGCVTERCVMIRMCDERGWVISRCEWGFVMRGKSNQFARQPTTAV